MAPTVMNNPLVFIDTYQKDDPNNNSVSTDILQEEKNISKKITKNSLNHEVQPENKTREYPADLPGSEYEMKLVWRNIIIFILLHIGAIYGYMAPKKTWGSIVFTLTYGFCGGFGITAGAHRLFAHKSYRANTALKVLLIYFQTIAFQNSVLEWARDHRVHHKFCDTNADPHNSRRGFFFSHMGWLLCKKHTDVKKFGTKVDMSDLEADPYIMFQHRHYLKLMLLVSAVIPTLVVWLYYEENFLVSFLFGAVYRYIVSLHITWLINSAAHLWGMRPYDKSISPVDTKLVAFLAFGEGWHNYHHVFPWDYKTSELGGYSLNFSTAFLDFFAWLGWATELKTVSNEMIQKRIQRTGDGSHKYSKFKTDEAKIMAYVMDRTSDSDGKHVHHEEDTIWGWGDKAMLDEDKKYVKIIN